MEKKDVFEIIKIDQTCRYFISFICGLGYDKPSSVENDDQETAFLFFSKHGLTSFTLCDVFWPRPISDVIRELTDDRMPDFPSAYVLIRNLYESFLILHYLLHADDEAEKELRYLVWLRKSLLDIRRFEKRMRTRRECLPQNERNRRQRYDRELIEVTEKIKQNMCFRHYDNDKQVRVLKKSDGRLRTFDLMAEEAGINENYHHTLYGYCTGYTHSNYHSFRHLAVGNPTFLMNFAKFEYVAISALLINCVKPYIFKEEIKTDEYLNDVIEFILNYIKDFDINNLLRYE